jgi:hypothetical protein
VVELELELVVDIALALIDDALAVEQLADCACAAQALL